MNRPSNTTVKKSIFRAKALDGRCQSPLFYKRQPMRDFLTRMLNLCMNLHIFTLENHAVIIMQE